MKIKEVAHSFRNLVGSKPHEAAHALGATDSAAQIQGKLEKAGSPVQEFLRRLQTEKQFTSVDLLASAQNLQRTFQAALSEGRLEHTEYVVIGTKTNEGPTQFLGTLTYFVVKNDQGSITDFGMNIEVSTVPITLLNQLQESQRDVYAAVAAGVTSSLQAVPSHRAALAANCHDAAMAQARRQNGVDLGDAHAFNLIALLLGTQQSSDIRTQLTRTTAHNIGVRHEKLQIGQAAHVHHLDSPAQTSQVTATADTGIYGGLTTTTFRITALRFNQIKQELPHVSVLYPTGIFSKRLELPNPRAALDSAALAGLALHGNIEQLARMQKILFDPKNVTVPIADVI